MDLNEYQSLAKATDQVEEGPDKLVVPLLGLAGEVGELLSEYKRHIREQRAYDHFPKVERKPDSMFPAVVKEELGDILWYAATLAAKFDLSLEDVAHANLAKLHDRYRTNEEPIYFDEGFPEHQRIPREFEVLFFERQEGERSKILLIRDDGMPLGDEITDNSYHDDGYRFHDVFHFSYATMLGWSPVTRKFMRAKRKDDRTLDEVEDGARSWVFEEAISLLVFEHARQHGFFAKYEQVDGRLLRDIKMLTAGIEVHARSRREWEVAILTGYEMWRQLREYRGGWIRCDLKYRQMSYRKGNVTDAEALVTRVLEKKANRAVAAAR
jgi:NTP pyrophosphatase (non-canonical NTP hydrolase)